MNVVCIVEYSVGSNFDLVGTKGSGFGEIHGI